MGNKLLDNDELLDEDDDEDGRVKVITYKEKIIIRKCSRQPFKLFSPDTKMMTRDLSCLLGIV